MSLYALQEINRIFNNSITAYENRCEREYQRQLEFEEKKADWMDDRSEEFTEILDTLSAFTPEEARKVRDSLILLAEEIGKEFDNL